MGYLLIEIYKLTQNHYRHSKKGWRFLGVRMEELKIFLNVLIERVESRALSDDYYLGKHNAYEEILAFIINKENENEKIQDI